MNLFPKPEPGTSRLRAFWCRWTHIRGRSPQIYAYQSRRIIIHCERCGARYTLIRPDTLTYVALRDYHGGRKTVLAMHLGHSCETMDFDITRFTISLDSVKGGWKLTVDGHTATFYAGATRRRTWRALYKLTRKLNKTWLAK